MPLCPVCDAKLNQDFGMVTCQSCQSVLMLDINGQIQVGSETISETDDLEVPTNNQEFDPFQSEGQNEDAPFFDNSITVEPHSNDGFSPAGEDSVGSYQDDIIESEAGVFEESKVNIRVQDYDESAIQDNDESLNDEVSDRYVPQESHNLVDEDSQIIDSSLNMPEAPDRDPVDITSFANSQDSNLNDGEYLYDLVIARIDSKELRDELKAVLQDEKLKLNFHEYIRKIKAGKVTIPNLNPIKTKRIVEQLQYLDFQIHWIQKRVVMQKEPTNNEGDDSGEGSVEDINL